MTFSWVPQWVCFVYDWSLFSWWQKSRFNCFDSEKTDANILCQHSFDVWTIGLLDVLWQFRIDNFECIFDSNILLLQQDIWFHICHNNIAPIVPQTLEPLAKMLWSKRLSQPHFTLPAIAWLGKFAPKFDLKIARMKIYSCVSCQMCMFDSIRRLCSHIRNSSHALCVRRRSLYRKAEAFKERKTNCVTLLHCVKRDRQSSASEQCVSRTRAFRFFVCKHLQNHFDVHLVVIERHLLFAQKIYSYFSIEQIYSATGNRFPFAFSLWINRT